MNFSYIIYAASTLGGLAIIFGAILGISSIKLHVEVDPRIAAIIEVLPGSNCEVCGLKGCAGAAEAVALGKAPYNVCVAGGHEVAENVARILGIEPEEQGEVHVAAVACGGGAGKVKTLFLYEGIHHCMAANQLTRGPLACSYGCLGFGDCVQACQFGALHMGDDGLPRVEREKCRACGICITTCPRGIMKLVPVDAAYAVSCNSLEKGNIVRNICAVGCIGCKICEHKCPEEPKAIVVEENLARFDYDRCTNCSVCVEKCPFKCIQKVGEEKPRKIKKSAKEKWPPIKVLT